ncbi:MAG: hypothetical protein U5L45_21260 [Saprospiraceae bacterium]|nr:hypothetical protein [Saprospiraceae bacterium]
MVAIQSYSKYNNLVKVEKYLDVKLQPDRNLFDAAKLTLIQPSEHLIEDLRRAKVLKFASEKERSERLVSPILSELAIRNENQITIYSGHNLDVDKLLGLSGECDFLLTLGENTIQVVRPPVFTVVEAKKQDLDWGTAQCAAQMVGSMRFNAHYGIEYPYIYGATTDGTTWKFLKLKGKELSIDSDFYTIQNLDKLLGVLQFILSDCNKFS